MDRDYMLRCMKTTNLCGTDTWEKDNPCRCASCRTYLAIKEEGRQEERKQIVAMLRNKGYWRFSSIQLADHIEQEGSE